MRHIKDWARIGALAPVAGLVLWLWILDLDIGARITFLYALLFLAAALFDSKGQLWAPFNRAVFGWAGGLLTIASIFLPWTGTTLDLQFSLLDPSPVSWFVPQLIAIGGILSLVSRYGGLVTIAGIWKFLSIPSPSLLCTANSCPMAPPLGYGYWLALAAIAMSLLGKPLNLPLQLRMQRPDEPAWL